MRPEAELDIECFSNWFLVGITDCVTGTEWDFQMVPGSVLDVESIRTLLQYYTIVTFNGVGYDVPMLMLALTGADCATLKAANDEIIKQHMPWWTFYKKYRCYPPDWLDHYDISEVAPGVKLSLKKYGCRMHSPLVMDTPVDFESPLPMDHVGEEIFYCRNDRRITRGLRNTVAKRIDIRNKLTERFNVDLRSKSDAQMAEAMVKAEWSRIIGDSLARYNANPPQACFDIEEFPHVQLFGNYNVNYRGVPQPIVPHFAHGTTFKVKVPDYVHFVTPYMQEFLEVVRNCDFMISSKDEAELMGLDGKKIKTGVIIPAELKGRDIVIGRSVYRVGIGGLHSTESSVSFKTTPGVLTLRTADVRSYYPSMMINANMNPPQLGPLFRQIFKGFYDDRMASKDWIEANGKAGNEDHVTIVDGYKIVLNGTFGKLFSRFSIFYAPEFGIAVTIGGQLSLLMLIERLEVSGIRVVSANTDGIELAVPFGREWIAEDIIAWWQRATGLVMEEHNYLALYSRDVNNYISMQFDGTVKRTGVFGESGVMSGPQGRDPDLDVCADAVVAFLSTRKPLRESITECTDIRKFLRVRGASGSATWVRNDMDGIFTHTDGTKELLGGVKMGRAVRWYYKTDSQDFIVDSVSLNKVAGSDGACPVMELLQQLPTDIDYPFYVAAAEKMLNEIAFGQENQQ